jgi:hypothetical protein
MFGGRSVRSFNEIPFHDFAERRLADIKNEIKHQGKDYILLVDENEYTNYLVEKYALEPLVLSDMNHIEEPNKSTEHRRDMFDEIYSATSYTFHINYDFTGTAELFGVRPNTRSLTSLQIFIDEQQKKVSFSVKLFKRDPVEFQQEKNRFYEMAFANIGNINTDVSHWNKKLPIDVSRLFTAAKKEFYEENAFYAAVNVKVNPATQTVFSAPTIKKRNIPQPPSAVKREISQEPTMAVEMYNDALKVIYEVGKSMEKKPSTYKEKDEESLRDQILLILETRYVGITATGETFNRTGKTDILLKHSNDGSNLFIAECKIWKGANEFTNAISQLFNYLTWRDSKTALIVFVKNKDFTTVLNTIKTSAISHPYFIKHIGNRGESSFSYEFCLPQDNNKPVYLEVIAFHYDK